MPAPSKPRRRTLSPEERALWQTVAQTTRALREQGPLDAPVPEPAAPAPPVPPQADRPPLPRFRVGERALSAAVNDLALPLPHALRQAVVQMDARTHARMTRGKIAPEARIDLHGMTLAEAHPELIRFVLNAHGDGMRLVLVITGKGKDRDDGLPIPRRVGALRHQVPQWLRLPPLGPAVQQVTPAHHRHGGDGALYVYLRRR
jgi:DNA-nicking Smr family endonuclease